MKYLIPFIILTLVGMVAGYRYGYRSEFKLEQDSAELEMSGESPEKRRTLRIRKPEMSPPAMIASLNASQKSGDLRPALAGFRDGLGKLAEDEVRAMLTSLSEVEDKKTRDELAFLLLKRLADFDHAEALQLTLGGDFNREVRRRAVPAIFRLVAEISPIEGYEFWKAANVSTKNPHEVQVGLLSIFGNWGRANLSEAFAEAAKIEDRGNRLTALNGLFSGGSPKSARHTQLMEFAMNLPPSEERSHALKGLLVNWSGAEPDLKKIEGWFSRQEFSNDAERAELERAVAEPRLDRDPQEAADWLFSRANEESYSGHLGKVIERWSRLQPDAAAKWLAGKELGPQTDEAVAQLARNLDDDDPSYALEWARAIHDPEVRSKSMSEIMRSWARNDPDTARQFLENTDIAQTERDLLEKSLIER